MTPKRFKQLRQRIGSQAKVAEILEVRRETVLRWEKSAEKIDRVTEYAILYAVEKYGAKP